MSTKLDLIVYRDVPFSSTSIWLDDEKAPIPMLGWKATFNILEAANLKSTLTLVRDFGITLGDSDGTLTIDMTLEQIDLIPFSTGLCTLLLLDTDNYTQMFSSGTITIVG